MGLLKGSFLQHHFKNTVYQSKIFKYLCHLKEFFRLGMKIVAFIISFIILGFSCLPCTDAKALLKDANQSVILTHLNTDQDSHQDLCNPFCSCACCGTSPSTSKIAALSIVLPCYLPSYQDNYTSSFTLSVSLPIWQPPRVLA